MFGIAERRETSLAQGSSPRKRSATSYVAPPHASTEKSLLRILASYGATWTRSLLLTLVAKRDWCASLKVVSVIATGP